MASSALSASLRRGGHPLGQRQNQGAARSTNGRACSTTRHVHDVAVRRVDARQRIERRAVGYAREERRGVAMPAGTEAAAIGMPRRAAV